MRRRRRCALAGTTSSSTIHNASFGTGAMVRAGTCRRSVPDPRKGGKEETGPPRPGCGTVPEAESGRIRSVNTGTSHAGGVILNRAGEEEGASIGTGLVAIRVSVTESTALRFDAHPWRGHREEREQERRPPRSVCRSIPGRGFDSHPSVCPKEQAIACFSIPSTPPLRIDPTQVERPWTRTAQDAIGFLGARASSPRQAHESGATSTVRGLEARTPRMTETLVSPPDRTEICT